MPVKMTGETLFTDLREKLLHYKNADAINQQRYDEFKTAVFLTYLITL